MHSRTASQGYTIVELMISVLLGLLVMGTASVVYLGNRSTTVAQRDLADLAQGGSISVDILARMFRQAGQVAISGTSGGASGGIAATFCIPSVKPPSSPPTSTVADGPFIEAWDNKTFPGNTLVNNSDAVLLRFDGSSQQRDGGKADGSIVDCLGTPVAGPTPGSTSERSWAKLYVAVDSSTGNPALYCSYRNSGATVATTQPLIDNVETFQMLYGIGALYNWEGDTKLTDKSQRYRVVVEKYLPAASLSDADWGNIAAVRFGIVVSGNSASRGGTDNRNNIDVLGPGYGTQFDATSLSASRRARQRQAISTTVELRNAPIFTGCNLS
jgi:type IV pilus assembly protein PilW